jgi:hypothetical protein
VTTRPSILVDRMSIPPPARAGRGAAAHRRNTTSDTARSGVKTIRSEPVTVPPEKDTVADSRGRLGSGKAYVVGHELAAAGDAAAVGRGLALGLALALGAIVAVAVSDGEADSAVSGPSDVTLDVLHPATSAARTTHEVRTHRR